MSYELVVWDSEWASGRTKLQAAAASCQGQAALVRGRQHVSSDSFEPEIPVPAVESRLRPLLAHGRLEDGLKLSKIVELNLAGVQ